MMRMLILMNTRISRREASRDTRVVSRLEASSALYKSPSPPKCRECQFDAPPRRLVTPSMALIALSQTIKRVSMLYLISVLATSASISRRYLLFYQFIRCSMRERRRRARGRLRYRRAAREYSTFERCGDDDEYRYHYLIARAYYNDYLQPASAQNALFRENTFDLHSR